MYMDIPGSDNLMPVMVQHLSATQAGYRRLHSLWDNRTTSVFTPLLLISFRSI